jgi:arylsulfatase A-like enzyme
VTRLRFLVVSCVVLLSGVLPRAVGQEARRPNVLFLFADDQRPDSLGVTGNLHARTPHVDALADRGFRFEHAYCMGSRHGAVCAPSRAMMMSGRTLHRVSDSIEGAPTWPQRFGASGYVTFGTGKWHNGEASYKRSFQSGKAAFFGGMSDHFAVPVRDWDGQEMTAIRREPRHSSELFADAAIDFLDGYAAGDETRPFACYVAFTAPHDPRDAPADYLERWRAAPPPLPPNFRGQHVFNISPDVMRIRDESLAGWPRDPETVRTQLAEYYALIEHLDAQVGRILERLAEHGLADNTVVVYAADHGLALGSHGLLGKQSLYEHSMGTPVLLAGPGVPQGRSDALVYLFDLFPTLCGLGGVSVPEGVEGRDLGPVMRGEASGVRDSLFTLYRDSQRAVRDDRYKLIRLTRTGKTMLFDLATDPHELTDLAGLPSSASRVAGMLDVMRRWQTETGDPQSLTPAEPLPLRVDLSGSSRKPDRHQPAWIRARYFGEAGGG